MSNRRPTRWDHVEDIETGVVHRVQAVVNDWLLYRCDASMSIARWQPDNSVYVVNTAVTCMTCILEDL